MLSISIKAISHEVAQTKLKIFFLFENIAHLHQWISCYHEFQMAQRNTVLCKSNESEFRRISFIVLSNFRRYVGEISHRPMRYFEDTAAKLCEFFRNFEIANFICFRNFEEMNFLSLAFSKQRTIAKTLYMIFSVTYITPDNSELNALCLYLFTP